MTCVTKHVLIFEMEPEGESGTKKALTFSMAETVDDDKHRSVVEVLQGKNKFMGTICQIFFNI